MDKKTFELVADTITKVNAQIKATEEMIVSNAKLRESLEKKYEQILSELKNIKDSIYSQEKFHRGH